jgi:hypothetical protein
MKLARSYRHQVLRFRIRVAWIGAAGWLSACTGFGPQPQGEGPQNEAESDPAQARVISVDVSGEEGAFTFAVEIASPDTGCDRYADWWEVVTPDGKLLHRRILLHSHVDEQPFTRSGGPVHVSSANDVLIRVHIHPDGYASSGLQGSAGVGFAPVVIPTSFAPQLETTPPLPEGCAF